MRMKLLMGGLLFGLALPATGDPVIEALRPSCGQSFAGRMVSTDPADTDMAGRPMALDVRACAPGEIEIPFHVGDDRSRTWFLTKTDTGYRLKHRHRHADGSPDRLTNYGGDHLGPPLAVPGGIRLAFPADAESKAMFIAQGIPQSATNVWAIEIRAGQAYVYELRREGRHFRVEFDLTAPIDRLPAPWGEPAG